MRTVYNINEAQQALRDSSDSIICIGNNGARSQVKTYDAAMAFYAGVEDYNKANNYSAEEDITSDIEEAVVIAEIASDINYSDSNSDSSSNDSSDYSGGGGDFGGGGSGGDF